MNWWYWIISRHEERLPTPCPSPLASREASRSLSMWRRAGWDELTCDSNIQSVAVERGIELRHHPFLITTATKERSDCLGAECVIARPGVSHQRVRVPAGKTRALDIIENHILKGDSKLAFPFGPDFRTHHQDHFST